MHMALESTTVIVLLLGTSLYISKYYINRQAEQEEARCRFGDRSCIAYG